jgi:hypothetical protein
MSWPNRRPSAKPSLGDIITAAAKELHERGEAIWYRRLGEMAGVSVGSVRSEVNRLQRIGAFPYPVLLSSGHQGASVGELAIEAAKSILAAGGKLTYDAMAEVMGCSRNQVKARIASGRQMSRFPYRIMPSPTRQPPLDPHAVPPKKSEQSRRSYVPGGPDLAIKAQVLAEARAGMIDGRREEDDTPPGVAVRSFRDHAEWSGRKFVSESSADYQRTSYRAVSSPKGVGF